MYLQEVDNPSKEGIIHHGPRFIGVKGLVLWTTLPGDQPASYQLVGGVIAYQGDDG